VGRVWWVSGENTKRPYKTEGDGGAPDGGPDMVVVLTPSVGKVKWFRQRDVDGPRMSIARQEGIRQREGDWWWRGRDSARNSVPTGRVKSVGGKELEERDGEQEGGQRGTV
jgi:hypothetical protein